MTSSLGTSGFSSSLRNSSKLSASPPFRLFLSSSGTKGVRQRVNIWWKTFNSSGTDGCTFMNSTRENVRQQIKKCNIVKQFDREPKEGNRDLLNYAATWFCSVLYRGKPWAYKADKVERTNHFLNPLSLHCSQFTPLTLNRITDM